MQLSEYCGEKKYDDYARAYTDFMISTKPFINYQMFDLNEYISTNSSMINTPMLDFTLAPSLPFIYRLIKEDSFSNRDQYVKWVDEKTKYARFEQTRLPEGNFVRFTPKKYTTWVDDMFMGLPYLVQASMLTENPKERNELFDDMANQVLMFNKQVWDTDVNLYRQAQYSEGKVLVPHWSRGNGWGIWAISEVLKVLPKTHPNYEEILTHFQNHVSSLIQYQTKEGFWRNVLDVEESRLETSGSAIFTMAIARGVNEGWLSRKKYEKYALLGWSALDSYIDSQGSVTGICMGTSFSEDVNHYMSRPFVDNDSHGLLGVLLAGIEVQRMIDK